MNRTARAVMLFAALFFVFLSPCNALNSSDDDDDVDDFSDAIMNQRYDWVITADTTTMKKFLQYPGSGLYQVSKVKVSYRLTARFARERVSYDPVAYEELWYHDCRPIGCRKTHQLGVESGQQGIIYFPPKGDISNNHCAVANTIVRLILDTGLKSAMLSGVIVPEEIFEQVQSDLGQFNFFPYRIPPDSGISATMHIFLQSQPKGREASLFYSSK
jgi:hypothetical protein